MANRKARLTQRVVSEAKPSGARFAIHDTEVSGFRLYVTPTGRKSFHLRYRVGGGREATIREPKIGEAPSMKAEAARRIALDWMTIVRGGGDPSAQRQEQRNAPRMVDLFERYLCEHSRPHKKASSVEEDERLIAHFLGPAFSKRKVSELTRLDVANFHSGLRDRPYRANRSVALLSKAMNLAELWGWRPDGSNPCRHVRKYREEMRKRFLSEVELARLGDVLRRAEHDGKIDVEDEGGARAKPVPISRYAIAAIRLLILTGARKGEILGLCWDWIDWENGRAHLPDSKTGEKVVHLPPAALEELRAIRRLDDNPHVIVGGKPGAALVNLKDPWAAIRGAAGLPDVRIHDLRHSYASVGAGGGLSLPIIGALLGHSQTNTTQRYAHLADDPLRDAAGKIGDRIAAALNGSFDANSIRPRMSKNDQG